MVLNLRNKKLWKGVGLTVLGLLIVLFFTQRTRLPSQEKNQPAPARQSLESTIINKLEEKQGPKDFFAEYRMERESTRGQQMDLLGKIINDPTADRTARVAASNRLMEITEEMEKEMKIENLVKSRGFNDCVAIMEGKNINLVVAASRMSAGQEAELRQLLVKPGQGDEEKILFTLIEP